MKPTCRYNVCACVGLQQQNGGSFIPSWNLGTRMSIKFLAFSLWLGGSIDLYSLCKLEQLRGFCSQKALVLSIIAKEMLER